MSFLENYLDYVNNQEGGLFHTENMYHQIKKAENLLNNIDKIDGKIEGDKKAKKSFYKKTIKSLYKDISKDIKNPQNCEKTISCQSAKLLKYLIRLELSGYKNAIKAYIKGCGTGVCQSEVASKQTNINDKLKIIKKEGSNMIIDVNYLKIYMKNLKELFKKLKDSINECHYIETIDIYTIIKVFQDKYIDDMIDEDKTLADIDRKNAKKKELKTQIKSAYKTKLDKTKKSILSIKDVAYIGAVVTVLYNVFTKGPDTLKEAVCKKTGNYLTDEGNSAVSNIAISAALSTLEIGIPQFTIAKMGVILIAACIFEGYKYHKENKVYGKDVVSKEEFIEQLDKFCLNSDSIIDKFLKDLGEKNINVNNLCIDGDISCEVSQDDKLLVKGIFLRMENMFDALNTITEIDDKDDNDDKDDKDDKDELDSSEQGCVNPIDGIILLENQMNGYNCKKLINKDEIKDININHIKQIKKDDLSNGDGNYIYCKDKIDKIQKIIKITDNHIFHYTDEGVISAV